MAALNEQEEFELLSLERSRSQRAPAPRSVSPQQPDEADLLAGSPAVRFALGAASPILGAIQLGAEAIGATSVTEHLKRLEAMKQRGMTPAAELMRLKNARANMLRLNVPEATIARIDEQIAALGESPSAEPKQSGFDVAGLAGTVMSPAALGAMKIAPAASVLGRSGQGAGIGGGFGITAPVTSGDDYWGTKAAQTGTGVVLGGAIPPVTEAVRGAYRIGRNLVDPLLPGGTDRGAARLLAEAAGPKRAAIEAELVANRQFVPGSQPTAAEAAAPAGSPEFSALQRFAAGRSPSKYSDIATAQAEARQGALQGIGKTADDVTYAMHKRAVTAAKNYGASIDDVVTPVEGRIKALFERPSMKGALKRASTLVDESGQTFGSMENGFTMRDLQAVKMALDDIVADPKTFGIGGSEINAITKTRGELVNWLSNASPKWNLARRVYAAQSKPINEMQVGQELEKSLVKPIGVGERPGVFAGAMQEAPRTIKRATGTPRFENLEDVLQPENLSKVKGVLADLSRKAEQERLSTLGAGKVAQIEQPFGLPATGPLHQGYMIFKTLLGRVSKGITGKILDDVADALQLPVTTLKLMQKLPSAQQQQMIDSIITRKLGRGAIIAGTASSSQAAQQ